MALFAQSRGQTGWNPCGLRTFVGPGRSNGLALQHYVHIPGFFRFGFGGGRFFAFFYFFFRFFDFAVAQVDGPECATALYDRRRGARGASVGGGC